MEITVNPDKLKVGITKEGMKVQFEIPLPNEETAVAVTLLSLQFDTQISLKSAQIAMPLIHKVTQIDGRSIDVETDEVVEDGD